MDCVGLLTSPFMEIMKCSFPIIVQQIGYVKNLKEDFEKLKKEEVALQSRKEDVKREISKHGGSKTPTTECLSWLNSVEEILNRVKEIKEEYGKRDMRCLKRYCFEIPSNRNLGQLVDDTLKSIRDLGAKSTFVGKIVVDALPPIVEKMPTITIQDGTSTQRTLQKILECLRKQSIRKIGIWGMGGVGKTAIMKNLNNMPEIENMFQFVIWVTVTKECSIRKLQNEIAHRLSLELSYDESDDRVARRLFQRLSTLKFLLLMDDVCDKVDLNEVGIPCPNQDNGCKVVLTTRQLDVCHKMETDEEIKVDPLSKEEAWKLFRENVGEVVDSPRIDKLLASRVVDECGGLPLAVVVVSASLRKEGNNLIWKNALKELSSPATSTIQDMELEVFRRLQFSFDRLMDDDIKECFLYVALYPEDYEVDIFELIEYWIAEGLINARSSLVHARIKGHAILKLLIDASLLLQSDRSIYFVKMHDVIRDLALRITSPTGSRPSGHRFLVISNKEIEEPPENKEWEDVSKISFMQNKISKLPEKPNCPTLLTLLLQMNMKLRIVPESFFEHMHALQVLDLSKTGISSLPTSICNLVSLRGLYLRDCYYLETLPPQLGELKKLEVLDAERTELRGLPTEIGQLALLIVLQVAFSNYGHYYEKDIVVSSGTISRLSKLEQLSITIESKKFKSIGQRSNKLFPCAEEVIEGVSCLKRLKILEFYFPEVKHLEYFIERSHPWKDERFIAFNFIVGSGTHMLLVYPQSAQKREPAGCNRILTYFGFCDHIVPNAIVEVLSHANSFTLLGHKNVQSFNEFGMQNMSQLIRCLATECDKIEIFMEEHQLVEAALPNLEQLVIKNMPNLRRIWEGSFAHGSLNSLRILLLSDCPNLKNIFSRGIIRQLSNLEELTVAYCSALEEEFCEDTLGVEPEFFLPKLKLLQLSNLPSLVRISKDDPVLAWTSLEEVRVSKCHNLKKLPRGFSNARKLRRIMCEWEWWNDLEWDDNAIKLQLEPLFTQTEESKFFMSKVQADFGVFRL